MTEFELFNLKMLIINIVVWAWIWRSITKTYLYNATRGRKVNTGKGYIRHQS